MRAAQEIAKEECAREPIHRPGSIQPHGGLLVVDPRTDRVVGEAGDWSELLGLTSDPLGREVAEVLGKSLSGLLRGHDLSAASEALFVETIQHRLFAEHRFDVLAHRSGGYVLLEVEPALRDRQSAALLFTRIREAADRMRASDNPETLFEAAAAEVRSFTSFDRVLVYQFLSDDSGKVIGEARSSAFTTLLGHRFPGGDVPAQARVLYVRNVIRVIPDAIYVPALIRGVSSELDLSDSSLRSVSPFHLEYLANMGVRASMSVSLLKDGALWGLIACHARQPLLVPYETREACKYIAAELMRQLGRLHSEEETRLHQRLGRAVDRWLDELGSNQVRADIARNLPLLKTCFEANGISLRIGDDIFTDQDPGSTIDSRRLFEAIERNDETVKANLSLEDLDPDAAWRGGLDASVCAVTSEDVSLALLRFRAPEVVSWAGNPDEPVEVDEDTGRLGPRRSFEVWSRTQRGIAPPWLEAERESAKRVVGAIERLSRQERISALQADLIHVSRVSAMGALASTLAHELNQPLTAISNFGRGVRLLIDEDPAGNAEEARRYLDQMSSAALRAGQIVRNLRGMISKRPVTAGAVPVARAIQDALSLALPDARVRGIDVDLILPDARLTAFGDPVQIEQVLTNLIRNGCDAMEGQSIRKLTIEVAEVNVEAIEIRVSDTGNGLSENVQSELFKPFQTTKSDGMGLGLSICRTIIERHGGRIWLERTGGAGTEFRFSLLKFAS